MVLYRKPWNFDLYGIYYTMEKKLWYYTENHGTLICMEYIILWKKNYGTIPKTMEL